MCARLEFMFAGHYVGITIEPGGNVVAANTPVLFDARHLFPGDDNIGAVHPNAVDGQLASLRTAADQIRARLMAPFVAGAPAGAPPFVLRVQCRQGCARSPRTVAAFLVTHWGLTVDQAMRMLRAAYNDPLRGGCNQVLNEGSVRAWLEQYYASPHRRQ